MKNVGCFRRCLFVCGCVCGFVCQHNNFRTSKHRMMKFEGRCIAQKISAEFEFGGHRRNPRKCGVLLSHDTYCITQNVNKAMWSDQTSHRTRQTHSTCVWLLCWENQRRLTSLLMVFSSFAHWWSILIWTMHRFH